MQITILTSNDIDLMMPASTVEHHIHDALLNAYSIIFGTNYKRLPLTSEELDIINRIITSCFALLENLPNFNPSTEPEHDIIRMLNIATTYWFYKQWKKKKNKKQTAKRLGVWGIPAEDRTALRRTFKRTFNASPEQIIAASFFYLLPVLRNSIKNNDLWTLGAIIANIAEANIIISLNSKQIEGGKSVHTKEKKLNKAYKILQSEYPNIKTKPFDEQVLYCQEHFHLSEVEATELLSMMHLR